LPLADRIRISADPEKPIQVCDRGKHAAPRSVGRGEGYDWEATDAEFNYWHSLKQEEQDELRREAGGMCFLCALDRAMATSAGLV